MVERVPNDESKPGPDHDLRKVAAPVNTSRRVLVIDDEPLVRETLSSIMRSLGYTVHAADCGDAALASLERIGVVDVVLLDMTMPGLSIADTHRGLRAAMPGVPVILTSGYNDPDVLTNLLAEPRTYFVQKPFAVTELVEQIGVALT